MDAVALGSRRGGDETLLRGYLAGLAAVSPPDDRYLLYTPADTTLPSWCVDDPRFVRRDVPRRGGAARLVATLPRRLLRERPRHDLVLAFTHAPVVTRGPAVLVVTDLSFRHHPAHYPRHARLRLNGLVPRQARRSRLVVTISEFCRRDLVDSYGLDPARVRTVPCAIEPLPALDAAALDAARATLRERGVAAPYVLYLGNLHPRKNVVRLLEAFRRAVESGHLPDHHLVVAGARWWGEGEEAATRGLPPGQVRLLGRVGHVEREVLLRDADALAYPSLFEGFGLPPLEAMARGTPVLASDRTAMPEVCGDAAVLVDPLDVDAIADGLVQVTTPGADRDTLVRRGLARARHFDAERTGRALRDALAVGLDLPAVGVAGSARS